MRAIQCVSLGQAEIVDIPEPELKPDSILVRPRYVGCNPCDWLTIDMDFVFTKGQIVGVDYAGVVEKIGSNVRTHLKPGDQVTGAVAAGVGCDISRGCFADLTLGYGHLVFPVPKNVTMEQAGALGVPISTIAISMYQNLELPLPDVEPDFGKGKPILIFGASSSTGLWVIQFAKISGFRVIATCSPRNFELLKSYGADEVYDYHDLDNCINDVGASVGDDLQYVYSCVMSEDEPKLSVAVISSRGGKYTSINPSTFQRDDVQSTMTWGQSCMADEYKAGPSIQKSTPEQRALGTRVWEMALKYLDEGKLRTPPIDLRQGFDGVLEGIDDLRKGNVSGKKIVSRLV